MVFRIWLYILKRGFFMGGNGIAAFKPSVQINQFTCVGAKGSAFDAPRFVADGAFGVCGCHDYFSRE